MPGFLALSKLQAMREKFMPDGNLQIRVCVSKFVKARDVAALRRCTVADVLSAKVRCCLIHLLHSHRASFIPAKPQDKSMHLEAPDMLSSDAFDAAFYMPRITRLRNAGRVSVPVSEGRCTKMHDSTNLYGVFPAWNDTCGQCPHGRTGRASRSALQRSMNSDNFC